MIFAHFCCRHTNRYHVGWIELPIYCSICIAITILEFIPKLRLSGTFQPALCIASTTLYKLALCSDRLLAAFIFQTLILYPFAHCVFISITTHSVLASNAGSALLVSLIFHVRFLKRLSKL